jgi:hypothetical protein
MIFDYIFLLPGLNGLDLYLEEDRPQNFIIPISMKLVDDKKRLFECLYRSDHKFCFLIGPDNSDLSQEGMEVLVNLVTSFLFLPNYIKHNGSYVLLLNKCVKTLESKIFKERLKQNLQKQVVTEISIVDINTDQLQETNGDVFVSLKEFNCYLHASGFDTNRDNFITEKLQSSVIDKKWIVRVESKEDFLHKVSRIKQFEKLSLSINPLLTSLISELRSVKNNYTTAKAENELLKMKLKNTIDNLKALRDTANGEINHLLSNQRIVEVVDPARNKIMEELREKAERLESARNNIQQWYDKEYETLPLWYKRFGHLVKVMRGKRSFKSLFK